MGEEHLLHETRRTLTYLERNFRIRPRFARMPGGFSTHGSVSLLKECNLAVANGTAYPFDVDLCACLPSASLGELAADLGSGGGRIAIVHDSDDLHEKVASLLQASACRGNRVVTLSDLMADEDGFHPVRMLPLIMKRS